MSSAIKSLIVEDSGGDETDTGSICSVDSATANAEEHAASQAEVLLVKRPGSSKKRITKLTKVAKPPTRAEESDAGGPQIQDTLKECLVLMEDIRKNQQQHPGAFSTTITGPAQGSCYYCYVADHYSSFCALKIKHNAERLARQKRAQKQAKKSAN
jgi:hypothetical protein